DQLAWRDVHRIGERPRIAQRLRRDPVLAGVNPGAVCEIGMRTVGLEIEDRSLVGTPTDLIDGKEIQRSSKRNADKVSGREVNRGNETGLVETGPLGGEDGVLGRRLERGEQPGGNADRSAVEVMAEDPAHIVLLAIVSRRG